jgi:hypothetical protein
MPILKPPVRRTQARHAPALRAPAQRTAADGEDSDSENVSSFRFQEKISAFIFASQLPASVDNYINHYQLVALKSE